MKSFCSLLFALLLLTGCSTTHNITEHDQSYSDMAMFAEAVVLAKQNYVEKFPENELIRAAINGMMQELDPNSSFLDEEELASMEEEMHGGFCGIGVTVNEEEDGTLRVVAPLDVSPAFRAGVRAGDAIILIDGKKLGPHPLQESLKSLRGEAGTIVNITVRHEDGTEETVAIVREEITTASVRNLRNVGENIWHIRISQFNERVPQEFATILEKLKNKNAKGLIVDLRDNPGGLLYSACETAEMLLPKGKTIVTVKGRKVKENTYRAGRTILRDTKLPLVLLINKNTASAAEIFAAALHDNFRAVLVGNKTYGKASVQNILHFSSNKNCALRITTAYYFTPKGKCIHEKGILPDETIEIAPTIWKEILQQRAGDPAVFPKEDLQFNRAFELLRQFQKTGISQ